MKSLKTQDNSITFFNEEFQEHYHTKSGALQEAFKKYVEPLQVTDGQTILDVCFGLGYNSYAAIKKANNLKIIALEIDQEILQEIQNLQIDEDYEKIKQLAKEKHFKDNSFSAELLLGDARETIKQITQKIDIVFFDPFSPKVCPELWTKNFMQDVYNIMKKGAKLATYSCAGQVRRNLKAVGFTVIDGPIIGRRSPSTIAIKEK